MLKKNTPKKKRVKFSWRAQVIGIFALLAAVIFLPSTVLLFIGMMPTIVAALASRKAARARAISIGAMNLAGCTPFLAQLWLNEHSFEYAFSLLSKPETIVIMYGAAAFGMALDWVITSLISVILYQRGLDRKKALEKRQKELVERWGKEVKGDQPLDQYGFPLSTDK